MTEKPPKNIDQCPGTCKAYLEHRSGKFGGFFFCHRCNRSLSEDMHGDVALPIGRCGICGGHEFQRIDASGRPFKVCWNQDKHPSAG